MSGGYIDAQQKGEHQVVIFTVIGEVTAADRDYWNQAVANLKAKFPSLASVTLAGKPTPAQPPPPRPLAAP
jgi:hypothetical protein